jgi:formyltetrahydrofolate synthetase
VPESDLEIARGARLQPIEAIAEKLGLSPADLEPYGRDKAKVRLDALARFTDRPDGALVLVTAMTPTPAGEGKSTTTVGLGDAFQQHSLSDDPKRLGRPRHFCITIRDVKLAGGAGFVIAYAGDVMTMPGLPRQPAAETIDPRRAGQRGGAVLGWSAASDAE